LLTAASRAQRWPWPGEAAAQRENTGLFAQGVGLLQQHTGRNWMFRQDATTLFKDYPAALLEWIRMTEEKNDAAGR